ncbi:hypothetical protein [Paraburkholderia nodosa]|uniref:hypothetical protein n=1 Tax=Paraburkholderia nodosa TaxID=392320 RepID=UPI0008416D59|nr:hypothetical protein [Paraburkholderia nodosa]
MKATITAGGMLIVAPENELEAYALGRWSAVNLTDWFTGTNVPERMKFMVNCEAFPGAMDPVLPVGLVPRTRNP